MLWWDARKLTEPTERLQLCVNGQGVSGFGPGSVFGASCLDYNIEAGACVDAITSGCIHARAMSTCASTQGMLAARRRSRTLAPAAPRLPTAIHSAPPPLPSALRARRGAGPAKFLLGTEQGALLSVNMRKRAAASASVGGGKPGGAATAAATVGGGAPSTTTTQSVDPSVITPLDLSASGRHHGPVTAVQRNPFYTSGFLSVGDWGFRLWHDKNRAPILTSPYCKAFLAAGCWSYCRPGVLFTARADGVLDVWDLLSGEQGRPACSHRVSPHALASLAAQQVASASGAGAPVGGRLLAVGDAQGTVSLLQASAGLAVPLPDEKGAMGALLERESRREEALEKRAAAQARAARATSVASSSQVAGGGSLSSTPGSMAPALALTPAGAPTARVATLGGTGTPGAGVSSGGGGLFAGASSMFHVGDEGGRAGALGRGASGGAGAEEPSEAEARAVRDAEAAFFAAVGLPQGAGPGGPPGW